MDAIAETQPSVEQSNFSRCVESAALSALTSLLRRKPTEEEHRSIETANREIVPNRDLVTDPQEIKRQTLQVLNRSFSPHGYGAVAANLGSWEEVMTHISRGDRVLLLFLIQAGKDMHMSHITGSEGSLLYTNDQMYSFRRGSQLDDALKKTSAIYGNSFNSFIVKKRPPFPGKKS